MPTLETLTENDLKTVMKQSSLKKGRRYLSDVTDGVRMGNTIAATVQGSRKYTVEIEVADDAIHAHCSCPYNWGGYCKHVAAVLYQWMARPSAFVVQTAVAPTASHYPIEVIPIQPPPTQTPREAPEWLEYPYSQRQAAYPQAMSNALESQYKVQELRKLAQKQGIPIKGTRKDDIVQQICDHLRKPGNALKAVLNLDEEHRQVFQAVALLHFHMSAHVAIIERVAKQWGHLTQYKKIETYVAHLEEAGLIVADPTIYTSGGNPRIIPHAMLQVLPPMLTDAVSEASLPTHTQGELQVTHALDFVRLAHQLVLLLEQEARPLRPPRPRPRLEKYHPILAEWDYSFAAIAAFPKNKLNAYDVNATLPVERPLPILNDDTITRFAPLAGSEEKLLFTYHLLVSAGILQPGSPITIWPKVREQFLRLSEAEQGAQLITSYFQMDSWSELWLALQKQPDLQVKRHFFIKRPPTNWYGELQALRMIVLRVLANLPEKRWFALTDLYALLKPIWPIVNNLKAISQPAYGVYYGYGRVEWLLAQGDRPLDTQNNPADWEMAQGGFIRAILEGPLTWLGLVDIYREKGELVAFRLHGLGDIFWDRVNQIEVEESGRVSATTGTATAVAVPSEAITLSDNHTIIVDPPKISAQAHSYLDSLAILQEATTGRFTYQLSVQAVHQAFEAGQTVAQLREAWATHFSLPMPDPIKQQIEAWWAGYGQVRLYQNITVIEFDDEYALREMKATTSLEKQMIAEISPRLVLIPATAVAPLIAELEKAGYTPKHTNTVN